MKSLYLFSISTVLTLAGISAQAATNDLVYIAVDPCRVVDTRNAGGAISANNSRNFLASGTSGQLAAQGGTTNCPAPRSGSQPLAVSAYVLAVPSGSSAAGVLTAFPAGDPNPPVGAGSTVNFAAQQVIGNTTNVTLCDPTGSCPAGGEFAILARSTDQHVVVDIQGYYYAAVGSCPDDMVVNGSGCIDKYEASVWSDAAGTGTQYGDGVAYPCLVGGSDCAASAANPIFALSVSGINPSASITWYQAVQACANVGKRLPTTAEWQMAASGTIDPGRNSDPLVGCVTIGNVVTATGGSANCVSNSGAFDMIGNVWEYTSELDFDLAVTDKFGTTDEAQVVARALGTDFFTPVGESTGTNALLTLNQNGFAQGALSISASIGFRCAR